MLQLQARVEAQAVQVREGLQPLWEQTTAQSLQIESHMQDKGAASEELASAQTGFADALHAGPAAAAKVFSETLDSFVVTERQSREELFLLREITKDLQAKQAEGEEQMLSLSEFLVRIEK